MATKTIGETTYITGYEEEKKKKKNVKALLEDPNVDLGLKTLGQDKEKKITVDLPGYTGSAQETAGGDVPVGEGQYPDYKSKTIDEDDKKIVSLIPEPGETIPRAVTEGKITEEEWQRAKEWELFPDEINDDEATKIYKSEKIQEILDNLSNIVGDSGVRLSEDNLTKIPTPYDMHQLLESKDALNKMSEWLINEEHLSPDGVDDEAFVDALSEYSNRFDLAESKLWAEAVRPMLLDIVSSNMQVKDKDVEWTDVPVSDDDIHSVANWEKEDKDIVERFKEYVKAHPDSEWGEEGVLDQLLNKSISNQAGGKLITEKAIKLRQLPVEQKLQMVDSWINSKSKGWAERGQRGKSPDKDEINSLYGVKDGKNDYQSKHIPISTKLAMWDGYISGMEMSGGLISGIEGLFNLKNAGIAVAMAYGGPIFNGAAAGWFTYEASHGAWDNYKDAMERYSEGNVAIANRHIGHIFANATFGVLTGRHVKSSYGKLKSKNFYKDMYKRQHHRLDPEGISQGWGLPEYLSREGFSYNPGKVRTTLDIALMEIPGLKYGLDVGGRAFKNMKLDGLGADIIPGARGAIALTEAISKEIKKDIDLKDAAPDAGIKKVEKKLIGDVDPAKTESKKIFVDPNKNPYEAFSTEWGENGQPILRLDTRTFDPKSKELSELHPELDPSGAFIKEVNSAVVKMYEHNRQMLSKEGPFETYNYGESVKNSYPEINANGEAIYKLDVRYDFKTRGGYELRNIDNILTPGNIRTVSPKYFEFYGKSQFFNPKTGANKVFYHATPVLNLKKLKGYEKGMAHDFVNQMVENVANDGILWLAQDAGSAMKFVLDSKGHWLGDLASKSLLERHKRLGDAVDLHPVHLNVKNIFDHRKKSHINDLLEADFRGGEKTRTMKMWDELIDFEMKNDSGISGRVKEQMMELKERLERENVDLESLEVGEHSVEIKSTKKGKIHEVDLAEWLDNPRGVVSDIARYEYFEVGEWYGLEPVANIIKEGGYEGMFTIETGLFKARNIGLFTVENLSNKVKSINERNPSEKTSTLMEKETSLENKQINDAANVVYRHGFTPESLTARFGVEVLKEIYKDVKNGDLRREKFTGIAMYEEYLVFEKGTPSKKGFGEFIRNILKPDESSPGQTQIIRNMIDKFEAIKTDHASALKQVQEMPTGEGGPPKPTVKKDPATDNYVGNFNLDKVPEAQRPFYDHVYRAIGENVAKEVRGGKTWTDTKAEGSNPKYVEEQINKIFETEEIITKDGKPNPDLEVNHKKVYAHRLITSALVDVYKNEPSPANLAALVKSIKANSAILAESGRALQANKIAVETNHGILALDNMLKEIDMHAGQPGLVSKLVEWQRNMKLMSMSSVVRSSVGNTAHMFLTLADMPVSAVNNYILNSFDKSFRNAIYKDLGMESPVISEITRRQTDLMEFGKGWLDALPEAARKAWALLKEDPEAVRKYSMYGREAFKYNNAIGKGWEPFYNATGIDFGKSVRFPQRAQGAIDVIIREPAIQGFINRYASNKAINEGLKYGTKEYNARMKEILENPTPEMIKESMSSAEYITFQSELGPVGKQVNLLRSGNMESGQFFVPFFNTMVNIGKTGIHRSPLAFVTPKYWDGVNRGIKTGDWGPLSDANAKIMTGTSIMYLMHEIFDPTNNIEAEGSWRDMSREQRDFKLAQGLQQNSLRFHNEDGSYTTWSYEGYEPIATFIRAVEGYQQGETMKQTLERDPDYENYLKPSELSMFQEIQVSPLARAGEAIVRDFIDNPFLKGVSDLETLATNMIAGERGASVSSYLTDFGRGILLPNFISQSRKIIDPIYRDRPEDLYDAFVAQVPGLTHKSLPKLGLFGEAISHPNKEVGSMFAFKKTSNINLNYDAMYNELENIGMDKLPAIGNQGWSKEMSKEQIFFAKHIMGEHLSEMLGILMLDEKGAISSDWDSAPAGLKRQIVATHYNNAKLMAKAQFIDNWVFDAERETKEMIQTFENFDMTPDAEMMNTVKRFVYDNHNKKLMVDPDYQRKIKALKEEKEKEFFKKQENVE